MERSAIIEILARKAAGEIISDQEEIQLDKWRAVSPANRDIHDRIMSGIDTRIPATSRDTRRMLEAVNRKIRHRRDRRIAAGLSIAAILAAGIFLLPYRVQPETSVPEGVIATITLGDGREVILTEDNAQYAFLNIMNESLPERAGEPVRYNTITVLRGRKYDFTLADGTRVWLNEETVLEYPNRFEGAVREVSVTGEAFFDVASDTVSKFVVNTTDRLRVTVHGTRFNITSYEDLPEVKITLVEGRVKISDPLREIELMPNEQLIFERADAGFLKRLVDAGSSAEWIHGMFGFDSAPLEVILAEVEEWYGIEINYDREKSGKYPAVTFHAVRYTDPRRVLDILSDMTGIDFFINTNKK